MSGLVFSIANTDGKPVIYLGQTQTLTLTLSNNSGADMPLASSSPVSEDDAAGNTGLLYLFLGSLVSDPALVSVSCPGWTAQFQNTAQGPVWCLALNQGMTFKAGASLAVSLAAVSASGLPGPRQLGVDAYLADGDAVQLPVVAQNDPGKLLPLNIDFGVTGGDSQANSVYITENPNSPIASALVFRLSNPSKDTPIVPDGVSWGSKTPTFTLSFVYASKGTGAGALTSAERAVAFTRQTVQDYGNLWSISANTQGTPSWTLTPDQLNNQQILGTGAAASFEFMLGNIITQLAPGTTLAYLQWNNIPGYQDGYKAVPLVKVVPTPGIMRFISLTPSNINQSAPVQLMWQTFALTQQKLSWMQDNQLQQFNVPPSATNYSPNPQPDDTVTYTLDGYDSTGTKVASQQLTISVSFDAPVISAFTVTPQLVAFDQTDDPVVTCEWQAINEFNATINGEAVPSPYDFTPSGPGTVTLQVFNRAKKYVSDKKTVYNPSTYVRKFTSTSQVSGGSGGPTIDNVLIFEKNGTTQNGTWTVSRSDPVSSCTLASQGFSWTTEGYDVTLTFDDNISTATLTSVFGSLTLSSYTGQADSHGLLPLVMAVQNASGQQSPVFSAQTGGGSAGG